VVTAAKLSGLFVHAGAMPLFALLLAFAFSLITLGFALSFVCKGETTTATVATVLQSNRSSHAEPVFL
jgi:hypothetical protein